MNEPSFTQVTRPVTPREERWLRLKLGKARKKIRREAYFPTGCLVITTFATWYLLSVQGSVFWIIVWGLIALLSVLSIQAEIRRALLSVHLEKIADRATTEEVRIVSPRSFKLTARSELDSEAESPLWFFDIGTQGTVMIWFEYRAIDRFPDGLRSDGSTVVLLSSYQRKLLRFPTANFSILRYRIDDRPLWTLIRCFGNKTKPTRSIKFSDDDAEFKLPAELLQPFPRRFDEFLQECVERA